MRHMTAAEWETLSELLVMLADQPLPTWQEKKEHARMHLSTSALIALQELTTWDWED